jgi:membrane associated rhomboid family serine protease
VIGASAADSGLMGAAARFIFRPGAALGAGAAALQTRASSLRELVFDRNALVFIAIWMATNFLFGVGATALGASDAPVAWIAHVGGFVAGLFAFALFDRGSAASASA